MRYNIVIVLTVTLVSLSYGDQYRDYMNKGQRLYKSEDYQASAKQFYQAEVLKPDDPVSTFNYGAALYKSQDYNKAANKFSQLAATAEKKLKSDSYHDLGNSLYRNQDYAGALQAYKNVLINNPANVDAKYNFELAKMRLEQQQQRDKEEKDQNQQKQEKEQEQQNKQLQDQQQQQKPPPKKGEMTEQEAKELLEAFKEDEKQIQKELKKFKIKSSSTRDW